MLCGLRSAATAACSPGAPRRPGRARERAAVERNALDPDSIDEIYMGCANQAGEDNRNVARMAGLLAGLPVEVPGVTVNRLCASGLGGDPGQPPAQGRRGRPGARRRRGVDDPLAVVMRQAEQGFPRGNVELARHDARLAVRQPAHGGAARPESMGETGENVAERYEDLARGPGRLRPRVPPARGRRRQAGRFDDEIVTVNVPQRKGEPGDRARRRGAAARHHARAPREAAADLPRGRHRHRRQLVAHQRRRGVPGARERGARPRAGPRAAGPDRGDRRRPASTRPTWASARSRPAARRSSAPG